MDGLQYFILAILVLVVLNNMHVRYVRSRLIRDLMDEGKSAKEIETIIEAYRKD